MIDKRFQKTRPVKLTVRTCRDVDVIDVQGVVLGTESRQLSAAVANSLAANTRVVIVNLEKVAYFDEVTLETLQLCHEQVTDYGGRFAIALGQPRLCEWPRYWSCQMFLDEKDARENINGFYASW